MRPKIQISKKSPNPDFPLTIISSVAVAVASESTRVHEYTSVLTLVAQVHDQHRMGVIYPVWNLVVMLLLFKSWHASIVQGPHPPARCPWT